jgi:hypothetical protein
MIQLFLFLFWFCIFLVVRKMRTEKNILKKNAIKIVLLLFVVHYFHFIESFSLQFELIVSNNERDKPTI